MGKISKHNIAQYKQNRISLVVKDLSHYAPEEAVRKIMLKRLRKNHVRALLLKLCINKQKKKGS